MKKKEHLIKEFEEYLNLNIKGIESDWKLNGEIDINNQKYNEYSENVLQEIQKLNDELKNISENESDEFKKDIKILLSLESENYNITLNIFINKVKCFDLIKDDEDKKKIENKEKEILSLREDLSSIREQINDFITNLKYKYLY